MVLACASAASAAEQNAAQAFVADATLLASARGWEVNATVSMIQDQSAFASLASKIREDYPDDFSSAVNFPAPGSSAVLYFKGSVPTGASTLITSSGLSVTTVTGTGKDSDEWSAQVDAIAAYLRSNSYSDFAVAFDSVDTIDVVIGSNASLPTLPSGISTDVSMSGISGAVVTPHAAVRGGSQILSGCTSAWTVETNGGNRGMTTAGHCSSVLYIEDRFGVPTDLTYQNQHNGTHGDFEWFTTVGNEVAVFWSDASNHRDVNDVKSIFLVNDATCVYERASDDRECDQVYRSSVSAGANDHLVATDTLDTIPGDSGGGTSFSTTAHGVTLGALYLNGALRGLYSKASRIDNALGVEVVTVP